MHKRRFIAAGAAGAVSLIIAFPAFAAETTTHVKHGIIGTVSAISGDTITVRAKSGTTYAIEAADASVTKGFGKNAATIALDTVSVGDTLAVKGTVEGTTVSATAIKDLGLVNFSATAGTKAHAFLTRHNATFGTISSVNEDSFTLNKKSAAGSSTVTVSFGNSTVFKKDGVADVSADIAAGQRVVVRGTKNSDGSLAATSVNVMTKTKAQTKKAS